MLAAAAGLHQPAARVRVGGMVFAHLVRRYARAEPTADVRRAPGNGGFRRWFRWIVAAALGGIRHLVALGSTLGLASAALGAWRRWWRAS
ncbi:MAG: hypothetical protein ACLFU0_10410 [Alphaproteobacteria bacterium]